MKRPLDQAKVARASAQTVMETVREPVLVLDGEFRILSASGSFFRAFKIDPESTLEQNLFGLDNGAWNGSAPASRTDHSSALGHGRIRNLA